MLLLYIKTITKISTNHVPSVKAQYHAHGSSTQLQDSARGAHRCTIHLIVIGV